ncbi:MAG: AAA family ATPase [Myxococcales bacterium]|nr:AAA family ATPase [Myxococcales bacterium]
MSQVHIPENELPTSLDPISATQAAYASELTDCRDSLVRGLPVLVSCDKQLVPYFYRCLRDRLKAEDIKTQYLDGRPRPDDPPGLSLMGRMLYHLSEAVRGAVEERVLVLPHLDLLMGGVRGGGLSSEAREVVALLYENPTIVWLGFQDLTLGVPEVIENLFPRKVHILGVPRQRLGQLVTQSEARKFGQGLRVFELYRYVSGVNAVQLRRALSAVDGEDYPADPQPAWDQLRNATLTSDVTIPNLDLHGDIGGYDPVKERLQLEIIDLVKSHQAADSAAAAERIEALVPRGIIFWGPPGTGKTLFAKAMAHALGAAVIVVSGPELKSKWVGESESNLRRVFVQARQSAPSVIIFDELDSFASARGTYDGAGVQHSMVNQLLTEMDGFRRNEMVFVVGTTNFVESLDQALLRPGRFEFKIAVPFPNEEDREAILRIYDQKWKLGLSEEALRYAVKRTGDPIEGGNQPYSGDHLQAACRALARQRMRDANTGPSEPRDVEAALTAHVERPRLTPFEERVVAVHECGHAICALYCDNVPPIQRITIQGDLGGALGSVRLADPVNREIVTRKELLDRLCVLFGGRAAEQVVLGDISAGAVSDIHRATQVARDCVEILGMGTMGAASYRVGELAEPTRAQVDTAVLELLQEAEERARRLVSEHRPELEALCSALLTHKVLDAKTLSTHLPQRPNG